MNGRSDAGKLTAFLLGRGEPPDAAVLRAANLGAYAYGALPADHPARPAFRPDFLTGLARHQAIKREVAPLLAAWSEAGIRPLLFKGFHLAEFVYPAPGMRFHGDVDVVIDPRHLRRAAEIAAALGWTGFPAPRDPPIPFRHSAYNLHWPGGAVQVDLQRYVIHCALPWARRQRRLTRAVLARSTDHAWEGAVVRVPDPVDAALVCLLVHRAWGAERWGLKPHDLLDLRFLAEREGVTRAALEARAAELGCRRTLAAMLERCDPWLGRFAPGRPTVRQAWTLDLRTLPEHAPPAFERAIARAARAPIVLPYVARALPLVLRARDAARRERDLHRLLATFSPEPGASPGGGPRAGKPTVTSAAASPTGRSAQPSTAHAEAPGATRVRSRARIRLARGIKWASRLVPARGIGRCVIRSLALYHALRVRGLPVEFVSGVRRDATGVVGHAWVEVNGRVLPELAEPDNPRVYRENFRYPPRATAGLHAPDGDMVAG
ncbi:MAG TPA: lasso peptide biosynthesis B2 protein [Longimicrobiales bacterium]